MKKTISVLIPEQLDQCWFLTYHVVRCLKKANGEFNINVIFSLDQASTDSAWMHLYKHSRYIDNLIHSKNDIDSIEYLEDVTLTIKNTGIDIVFPCSAAGFKFVSKHRNELSNFCRVVELPSDEALHTALDKWKLHLFLSKHNITAPKTVLLKEVEQLRDLQKNSTPGILDAGG
jgi:D-aspartate ligase